MVEKYEYTYTGERHITTCIITDEKGTYKGVAVCNPEDNYSERSGQVIAYQRAAIKMLKRLRNDTRSQLQVLNHLMGIYKSSKRINEKDYGYKMLERTISQYEHDLADYKLAICANEEFMKEYIKHRSEFYND